MLECNKMKQYSRNVDNPAKFAADRTSYQNTTQNDVAHYEAKLTEGITKWGKN